MERSTSLVIEGVVCAGRAKARWAGSWSACAPKGVGAPPCRARRTRWAASARRSRSAARSPCAAASDCTSRSAVPETGAAAYAEANPAVQAHGRSALPRDPEAALARGYAKPRIGVHADDRQAPTSALGNRSPSTPPAFVPTPRTDCRSPSSAPRGRQVPAPGQRRSFSTSPRMRSAGSSERLWCRSSASPRSDSRQRSPSQKRERRSAAARSRGD